VARVVAFIPDLLFGSNVVGALQAAGHAVTLTAAPAADGDVLVVDLTADVPQRIEAARKVIGSNIKTLAFYSHVEGDVRAAAQDAGFDLVVPRSRMAREGAALIDRLVADE
jgi:hypothetical protein